MDKSKLIAIIALVGGIALIVAFKQPPSSNEEPPPAAQTGPTASFDVAGGVTKLQIKDVRPGTGPVAKAGDKVSVNYRGTLLNGELFDESYGRAPFDFQLGARQVIKGWDEGVAGMKVGGKRQLTIPADMGYGDRGSPPKIPGGATLKFDVELLSVNGKS